MPNPYPFQTFIDYWKFSVIIPLSDIAVQHENIYDTLSNIPPEEVQSQFTPDGAFCHMVIGSGQTIP
jgi:hypothetical protein